MQATRTLVAIKLGHTVAWAFFVACICAIPIATAQGRLLWAAILSGIVLLECLVLAANRCRCPFTDWARRYTDEQDTGDRADNFDIYLPLWLARYNKHIFGTFFTLAELYLLARWLHSRL
jgi:hypothetical protein